MKEKPSQKSFNLLKWFAILSFASITLTSTLSGIALSRFLSEQLLMREAVVSMEFIQSISDQGNPGNYLLDNEEIVQQDALRIFFERITQIPDVIKANIFNSGQSIIWSSDSVILGKKFDDNRELKDALDGTLVFRHEVLEHESDSGGPAKTEHQYFPEAVNEFIESYIPIWDKSNTKVVGVVELYKAPTALFESLNQGRWLVIIISVVSGLILYAVLFGIVRRGNTLINQQNEALVQSERLASIGSLTKSIAHSIRNPLASIRSSAELSLNDANHSVTESLNDVIRESDRLDQWIRELLILSHTQELEASSTALKDVVNEAIGSVDARFKEKDINLILDLPDGLRNVVAEPSVLKQVIITLLTNSIEASNIGGRISVLSHDTNKNLEVVVHDQGAGISRELLIDVFTPLVSSKLSGLGLGLTLAKQAIEQFGGKLTLDSAVGQGTTATITLKPAV